MARKLVLSLAVAVAAIASTSWGQDALVQEMYGRGVHAFFSQNLQESFNSLSAAINSGSRDPRAFYFRGLAMSRMGWADAAKEDIRKAAELEMLGGEPYPVGRSLERIQGTERMMLESIRRQARLQLHGKQLSRDRERYEQIQRTEGETLRGGGLPAPPAPPMPDRTRGLPATDDPFATPPAALPPPGPATPPPPAPEPFATPPAEAPPARPVPAEAPPGADPFAPPPAAPAPSPPRPAPATPPPPVADPFAEPPTPAPTPAAPAAPAPAAPVPAPGVVDPFAEPPTTTPAAPPTP